MDAGGRCDGVLGFAWVDGGREGVPHPELEIPAGGFQG